MFERNSEISSPSLLMLPAGPMLRADKGQVYCHSSILASEGWAAGLPFSNLQRNEFEVLFELCEKGPPLKRNFLRGFVARQLRLESKKGLHIPVPPVPADAVDTGDGGFLSLPLDVLLEVRDNSAAFLYDLYNFSLTCKLFRQLLWNRDPATNTGSLYIWNRAFETSGLPRAPSRVDSVQWASFLFGRAVCQACTCPWKRTSFMCVIGKCHDCLVRALDFDVSPVLNIFPSVPKKLTQAASDWATRVLKNHLKWEKSWYEERGAQGLRKLGYGPKVIQEAIQSTFNDAMFLSRCRLDGFGMRTSRKDFRYHFKVLVVNAKSIHLNHLYEQRLPARRSLVTAYQIKNIRPSEWIHVPRQLLFHCDGGILPPDFDPSLPDSATVLALDLATWYGKLRNNLVETVRRAQPSFIGDGEGDEVEAALNLAAIVFSCANCSKGAHHLGAALVGWDTILTHICSSNIHPTKWHGALHWSEKGHASALALMKLVRKNPQTTAAKDMDKLDARFSCGNCECTDFLGAKWEKALTWRECLTHVLYCVKPGHDDNPQTWFLLSEEATQAVKVRERPYPPRNKPIWGCGRCAKHLETPEEYAAVVTHIATEHNGDVNNIAELEIGHDLVYFPNLFARYLKKPSSSGWCYKFFPIRKAVRYRVASPRKLCCLHCPPTSSIRLRWDNTRDLIGHIKEYHVPDPIEGRDYMEVEIISDKVTISR